MSKDGEQVQEKTKIWSGRGRKPGSKNKSKVQTQSTDTGKKRGRPPGSGKNPKKKEQLFEHDPKASY